MAEERSYPLTVKTVNEGGIVVFIEGIGRERQQSERMSVPKNRIPEEIQSLPLTVGDRLLVTTPNPYDTHTWQWSWKRADSKDSISGETKEIHGDMTASVDWYDDENHIVHFCLAHGNHIATNDYPCSIYDLPEPIRHWVTRGPTTIGYNVHIPKGMVGDPKEWKWEIANPVGLVTGSELTEPHMAPQESLVQFKLAVEQAQIEISDTLFRLTEPWGIIITEVNTFQQRDTRTGPIRYKVGLDFHL